MQIKKNHQTLKLNGSKDYNSMNFYTIRVAIRNGISGTPCWISYVHSQIYSYTFTYHQKQNKKKICHRIRTRKTTCYISSFISHVYYLHSVLPCPPMHCLSYSPFYMVCKTQMYIYLHTYIHTYYWLDSANEGEHGGFFYEIGWPQLVLYILSPYTFL